MTVKKMGLATTLDNNIIDLGMIQYRELNGVWPEVGDWEDKTDEHVGLFEEIEERHFGINFTETPTKEG
jgi:hypothetical protein